MNCYLGPDISPPWAKPEICEPRSKGRLGDLIHNDFSNLTSVFPPLSVSLRWETSHLRLDFFHHTSGDSSNSVCHLCPFLLVWYLSSSLHNLWGLFWKTNIPALLCCWIRNLGWVTSECLFPPVRMGMLAHLPRRVIWPAGMREST